MSDSSKNKEGGWGGILLGVAATAALAGIAFFYRKAIINAIDSDETTEITAKENQLQAGTSTEAEPESTTVDAVVLAASDSVIIASAAPLATQPSVVAAIRPIKEELAQVGLSEVRKRPSGTLEPQYVVELLNFMTTEARKTCEGEQRKEALEQRRKLFKEERWDEYRKNVKEQFNKENNASQNVMQEVLANLPSTSKTEFEATQQKLTQDSKFSQKIKAAQQGKLPPSQQTRINTPRLDKQQTLNAFHVSKNLSLEAIRKNQQSSESSNKIDSILNLLVEQAKVDDALFTQEQVCSDELEDAMMYYIRKNDAEIKHAMSAFMREMQTAKVSSQ